MPSEKTPAIVLKVVPFSESSCVVTMFTRDFGKISALAKGAKRPKSPFEAALDLLAVCRIVFLHRQTDSLDLLTEAKLERRFRSSSRDLSRLYAGYYLAELLMRLTETGDPHRQLYQAAEETLAFLDTGADIDRSILRFEMAALQLTGNLPSLDVCVDTGTPVELDDYVYFGLLSGGLLSRAARPGNRKVIRVKAEVIGLLRQFADLQSPIWRTTEIPLSLRGELRGLVNSYFRHLLGRVSLLAPYLGLLKP